MINIELYIDYENKLITIVTESHIIQSPVLFGKIEPILRKYLCDD